MLVEFRVGNYRSFHEPQTLSLVASSDRTHPENLIPCGKDNLLKAAALYGANASGKSNLVGALHFMSWFVGDSAAQMNVDDEITLVPFRLNSESRDEPSLFEVTLVVDEVRFRYGFTATAQRVHDEWLVAYPKGRGQRWFERRFDPHTQQTEWAFRAGLKKHGNLLSERTRNNGLVLSRGAELNVEQFIPVFQEVTKKLWGFDMSDPQVLEVLLHIAAKNQQESQTFRDRVRCLVQDADLGIRDLRVTDRRVRPVLPPSEDSKRISKQAKQLFVENIAARLESVHTVADTQEEISFDFQEAESGGTHRFFALAGLWLKAIENGGAVVLDELDCSLHPALTRKLIQLFQDADVNTRGAQLIFATHDSTLMDQSLFRRDQIWIVEKDAQQASRLFSLYDFDEKPRKGEALEKRYLAGRYGGVPMFGPTFEDLELR